MKVWNLEKKGDEIIKISDTDGIYSFLVIGILFLLVWCAGCSEQTDLGTQMPNPSVIPIQVKFVRGDIIAKNSSSADQFRLILKYDSLTGKYERASVRKKPDGRWYRNNDTSEFSDRLLTEKIYSVKVGHVSSLSLVPVETPGSVPLATQEEKIPSTITTRPTPSLSKIAPTAQFSASPLQGRVPLTVRFTDKSVFAGTTSYQWDINNDGVTDYTTKNPVHIYQSVGIYTVKLTVTNASGSDRETKTNYITVSSLPSEETYGAEPNPTGNPLGGGAGYSRIISETDSRVRHVVSTRDQLVTALKNAKPGEVVFVKGTAVIDMTGMPNSIIPGGVTLASDRGNAGSQGALIKYSYNSKRGISLFEVGGNNVRVTGLRLEGEMLPQDGTGNGEASYLRAITVQNKAGLEVDNCEIRGWAWSCVTTMDSTGTFIHHNYMHHNQANGEGYGADIYGGDMLVEANIFNYNRHDIAAGGYPGESYEARYNLVRGDGHPIGSHHFDVHACNPNDYSDDSDTSPAFIAGNLYKIHHNTFEAGQQAPIGIRSRPVTGAYIYNNIFMSDSTDTIGGVPVWQRAVTWGNMFVTNNYWKGTLYSGDEIVWYLHP